MVPLTKNYFKTILLCIQRVGRVGEEIYRCVSVGDKFETDY